MVGSLKAELQTSNSRVPAGHSPEELGGELKDPRLSRRTYNPEPAVREVSVWSAELSVVEGVERLDPDLQIHAFAELRVLMQSKVPVVETRPMEETTVGGAERPEGCKLKASLLNQRWS